MGLDNITYPAEKPGRIVQVVNTQTGAVATGATLIPYDDSIPQNNEGNQFMTLAITPNDTVNKLIIDVVVVASSSNANQKLVVALFQDTTANALACVSHELVNAASPKTIYLSHYMTANTVASTTFKVRVGGNQAATITFNGTGGSRYYGGVLASSITITEIK